ncbi:MAG: hypothetical protein Q7O12_14245 [Deltaproteobacteria bacterium]|nr:hypothetical protein [Deltaproteobacteria bacterium]
MQKGDHIFIRHESVINYGDAFETEIHLLEDAISKNYIEPHDPVSGALLGAIQEGVFVSDAFPPPLLKYFPA